MLVIGQNSVGKSTFLKIACYCRWVEKQIMGNAHEKIAFFTRYYRFAHVLTRFYRIPETFFNENSLIQYDSDLLTITLTGRKRNVRIGRKPLLGKAHYATKLCFVPSERNLIAAVKNIDRAYRAAENDVLFNYLFEWGEAREGYDAAHAKPLTFASGLRYENIDGADYILQQGVKSPLPILYASSGVQSALPIDVMVDYMTNLVGKASSVSKHDMANALLQLMQGDRQPAPADLQRIAEAYTYESVQIFVEEPEQNLYPEAQKRLLLNAVAQLQRARKAGRAESLLVMTTHSPYLISVLNVLIAASQAKATRPDDARIDAVVPPDLILSLKDFSAYYIKDDGSFVDIIDPEVPMISGNDLDGVSDWVDEKVSAINDILYGDE